MRKVQWQKEKYALIFILLGLLWSFYQLMVPFLYPVLLAALIVILTFPVHAKLSSWLGGREKLSAFLLSVLIFVTLILPSTIVATVLIDQLADIARDFHLKRTFSELFSNETYVMYVAPFVERIEESMGFKINILDLLTRFGKSVAAQLYSFSPKVLMGTANFVFQFFIMLVTVFFLFVEGRGLFQLFVDISPMRESHEMNLANHFRNTINASVYGYLLTGLVQGILAAIIFYITGLKGFAVLGTLTFFMSMVPVIGAAGVWVPVCVWLFLQGDTTWFLVNLVYGAAIISGIDNILKPIIIQGRTNIHPLLIFFSLFGGIALLGPIGILLGPVITASLIAVIQIYKKEYLGRF
jgi:predicted PurR-regulated permease PerM